MKLKWTDAVNMHRAYFPDFVTIKTREWGGGTRLFSTMDAGYVMLDPLKGRWAANIYGTVNPDAPPRLFDNIDDAKEYVETQALLGVVLNKLTR